MNGDVIEYLFHRPQLTQMAFLVAKQGFNVQVHGSVITLWFYMNIFRDIWLLPASQQLSRSAFHWFQSSGRKKLSQYDSMPFKVPYTAQAVLSLLVYCYTHGSYWPKKFLRITTAATTSKVGNEDFTTRCIHDKRRHLQECQDARHSLHFNRVATCTDFKW